MTNKIVYMIVALADALDSKNLIKEANFLDKLAGDLADRLKVIEEKKQLPKTETAPDFETSKKPEPLKALESKVIEFEKLVQKTSAEVAKKQGVTSEKLQAKLDGVTDAKLQAELKKRTDFIKAIQETKKVLNPEDSRNIEIFKNLINRLSDAMKEHIAFGLDPERLARRKIQLQKIAKDIVFNI